MIHVGLGLHRRVTQVAALSEDGTITQTRMENEPQLIEMLSRTSGPPNAVWSCGGLYRALRTHTPDELRLKRQFSLVLLRWVVVLAVTYTGIAFLFGRWAPFVFVAVYAGASIVIDLAPDKFLRLMPEGAAATTSPAAAAVTPAKRRKRKH